MEHEKRSDENTCSRSGKFTRRECLVRLGETAIIIGFGSAAGEARLEAASTLSGAKSRPQALPPGLYEPSSDHLTHALVSDDRFLPSIPAGTETDYVRARTTAFRPRFFSPQEFKVVERLVRLLLGNPSEVSEHGPTSAENDRACAEVAEWIDLSAASAGEVREAARRLSLEHRALAIHYAGAAAVEELEAAEPEKVSREGLRWLAEESLRRYGKPFLSLEEQHIELLKLIGDDRPEKAAENAGTRFFAFLKRETLRGFYTSQFGLKELGYKGNSFYAECPGCDDHS